MPEVTRPPRRKGSRLLLAAALVGGVAAALLIGASVPDTVAALVGIASGTLRLVLKVVGVIIALPVAFYFVERFFLKRASSSRQDREG